MVDAIASHDAAVESELLNLESIRNQARQRRGADFPPHEMPDAVAKAYRQYVEQHHGEINATELAEVMFNSGGRHAVTAMVTFGDIVPQLNRIEARVRALLTLLEAFS